jgi:hypothetical protein|tara:strand:- start:624 stop:1091 length:468 start_codon:yes stop_codon:yes gene_type:complete
MEPKIWGKYIWKSIHYIALGLPINPTSKDKEIYFDFYMNLVHLLPCQTCSEHLQEIYNKYPLTMNDIENASKLFEWTVKIHNEVNKKLNKPVMELDAAKRIYSNTNLNINRDSNDKKTQNQNLNNGISMWWCLFVTVVLLLFVIMLFLVQVKKNS